MYIFKSEQLNTIKSQESVIISFVASFSIEEIFEVLVVDFPTGHTIRLA